MAERRTKKPTTRKSDARQSQRALQAEDRAFERQKQALLANYEGEFVAMYQGRVVDHDRDVSALCTRVTAKLRDAHYLVKPVTRIPLQLETPEGVLRWG